MPRTATADRVDRAEQLLDGEHGRHVVAASATQQRPGGELRPGRERAVLDAEGKDHGDDVVGELVVEDRGVRRDGEHLAQLRADAAQRIERGGRVLIAARAEVATCAISGAVGTFANIDPYVEEYVCEKMGLKPEPVSTQVIPRDRHAAQADIDRAVVGFFDRHLGRPAAGRTGASDL